jgi:hypothetical protein
MNKSQVAHQGASRGAVFLDRRRVKAERAAAKKERRNMLRFLRREFGARHLVPHLHGKSPLLLILDPEL